MTEVHCSATNDPTLVGMTLFVKPASAFADHTPTTQQSQVGISLDSHSHQTPPVSAFAARTSRPRITNNRARPYQDTSSRSSSHRKSETPCRYFVAGNCTASSTCRYRHDLAGSDQDPDLDQQLRAFVWGEDATSAQKSSEMAMSLEDMHSPSTPPAGRDDFPDLDELSDEEELHEVIHHPLTAMSEVRFHSNAHPGHLRTYFVAKRQAVLEYEGNNVGVLSGGVLLGVPILSDASAAGMADQRFFDDIPGSDVPSSSPLSSASNSSDVELWQGPVKFDDAEASESLVWADEEFLDSQMGEVESSSCNPVQLPVMPTPPPVIRRIIRQSESHNRRHSLS